MFDREYSFRGSHADRVNRLTAQFDQNRNRLFNRNLDVYMVAPIIGFMYGRKADLDKGQESTKIFPEQLIREQLNLQFTYRVIMLLDKEHEPDFDERMNKAFRSIRQPEAHADEELFEQYVRGGVDVLYEQLIATANAEDDYLKNLWDFIDGFHERYNSSVSKDSIQDLCRLARS